MRRNTRHVCMRTACPKSGSALSCYMLLQPPHCTPCAWHHAKRMMLEHQVGPRRLSPQDGVHQERLRASS